MDLRPRDDPAFARNHAVLVDARNDWASFAVFSELKRIRIARIGVSLGVLRSMVVAKERVRETRGLDFLRIKRRMRLLADALFR